MERTFGRELRVDDQPRHPALPRDRVAAIGVEAGVLQVVPEVRVDVRDPGLVQILDVAELVHLLGHPVGHHDDAAASRLSLGQQGLHLGEELLVVVDVLDVVRVDPGRLVEVRHRVLVDVQRPVRDRQVAVGRGLVLHRRHGRRSAAALDPTAAAGGEGDRGRECPTRRDQSAESPLARHLVPPRFVQAASASDTAPFPADSLTTCMWSGLQESLTFAPPPGRRWRSDSSVFGTRTVMRTFSVSFTIS